MNHEAPAQLREAYAEIIRDEKPVSLQRRLLPTMGMPECKSAIVDFEKHLFGAGMKLAPENIAIGCNSTQLTFNLMHIMLSPGDKLLLLDPAYCNYPSQVTTLEGVKIIRFPVLDMANWRYVADEKIGEFTKFILAEKPKFILLCAPDNPTSQIPSTAFVKAALAAAQEVGAFLVIDFAYKELVWGGQFPEYFSWGSTENFCLNSFQLEMVPRPGPPPGLVEGPVEIIEALEAVQGSSILCPDSLHQMALADYVKKGIGTGSIKPSSPRLRSYTKRRPSAPFRLSTKISNCRASCRRAGFTPSSALDRKARSSRGASWKKPASFLFPAGASANRWKTPSAFLRPAGSSSRQIDVAMKRVGEFLAK